MKKHSLYSILAILVLAMMIGSALAQNPVPIGLTKQSSPFESNPTAWSRISTQMVATAPTQCYDGDLAFFGQIKPAATTVGSGIWFQLSGFTTPFPEQFAPGWVDLKMKYDIPLGSDDSYRIEYSVAPDATWYPLQPNTLTPMPTGIRTFAQIAEPNDGTWDWTDVNSIAVRVTYTKVGSYIVAQMTMNIYELWASVYPNPRPPSASTTLSVQPPVVGGVTPNPGITWTDNTMFVDIYVQGVTDMLNYEIWIDFDTTVLTPAVSLAYYPWTVASVDEPDDTLGRWRLSYSMPLPVPIGEGFTGNSPIVRLYFTVDWSGSTDLAFREGFPYSYLYHTDGTEILPVVFYNGFFGGPHYLSYALGTYPGGDPTSTAWHEDWPTYSTTWTITGWIDNGDFDLTPSDQIFMDDGSGVPREFHVDQVTITIHWTFKTTGEGIADPSDPALPPDLEMDPSWTTWHQIYPDYCRPFTITGWTDNGDGVFSPSDQFEITYDDDFSVAQAHLDSITTNIVVSEKPSGGPVPEFPLGIGLVMAIVPMIAIVYLWRIKPRKKVD